MKNINKNVSDFLLSEICLDNRVEDGTFDIFNNDHMDVLREKLVEMGIPKSEVIELANKVTEGKYPERQAYNAHGILVTFPNPEYKQRALSRGTHFEEDPTKGQSNIDYNEPSPQNPVQEPATQTPAQIEPVTAPAAQSTPPQPTVDDLQTRSPEQKKTDAEDVEKILTAEFTLEEAATYGWIRSENGEWYDSESKCKGYEWHCVKSGNKKIISRQ
jgi:hypothetical protein